MILNKEKQYPKPGNIVLIMAIFEKADAKFFSYYRGFALTSTTSKVFTKITEKRVKKKLEII